MGPTDNCKTLLECALYWEKNDPNFLAYTQPMGGGDANIKTWTWKEAVGEARKMAAYLKSLNLQRRAISHCAQKTARTGLWQIWPSGWQDMSPFRFFRF